MKIEEIIAASGNTGKIREIEKIFRGARIIPMREAGFDEEIEETGSSFRENALIKARTVCRRLGKPALADDSAARPAYTPHAFRARVTAATGSCC